MYKFVSGVAVGIVALAVLILAWVAMNPGRLDRALSDVTHRQVVLNAKLKRAIVVTGKLNSSDVDSRFAKYCTYEPGINPEVAIKSLDPHAEIESPVGPLFMSSDRDWHLAVQSEGGTYIIIAFNNYIFPLLSRSGCSNNLDLTFR